MAEWTGGAALKWAEEYLSLINIVTSVNKKLNGGTSGTLCVFWLFLMNFGSSGPLWD